jgi:hypothetical protein
MVLSLFGEPSVTTMMELCWHGQQMEHWLAVFCAHDAFTRPAEVSASDELW